MSRIPSAEDKQQLAALALRPEWDALSRVAEERMEKHFQKVVRLFMSEGYEPDYDRLQWQRGVFAGMKFLLDNPTIEAKKLAKLLAEEEVTSSV